MRGEVIINLMFDDVNRHLEDPRPEITSTYDPLFGGPGWYDEIMVRIDGGEVREYAVVDVYRERLRRFGRFSHVTSTRILKPLADRTYYYLVYGTRHAKGIVEFRSVEKFAIDEQENARDLAKITRRIERTGQTDLFADAGTKTGPRFSEFERLRQLDIASKELEDLLQSHHAIAYDELLGQILERPMVWESDLKTWLEEMRSKGEIEIPELRGRARVPQFGKGHTIRWITTAT